MAKRRFLIKGGKGSIGVSGRQVTSEDIVYILRDNTQELVRIINQNNFQLNESIRQIRQFGTYGELVYTDQLADDFSNASLFFNPNAYLLSKNTQGEFFFGIDRSKNNARLDPRGIFVTISGYDQFQGYLGSFYCKNDEQAVFEQSNVVFYKVLGSFRLTNLGRYPFSVVRETVSEGDPMDRVSTVIYKEGDENPNESTDATNFVTSNPNKLLIWKQFFQGEVVNPKEVRDGKTWQYSPFEKKWKLFSNNPKVIDLTKDNSIPNPPILESGTVYLSSPESNQIYFVSRTRIFGDEPKVVYVINTTEKTVTFNGVNTHLPENKKNTMSKLNGMVKIMYVPTPNGVQTYLFGDLDSNEEVFTGTIDFVHPSGATVFYEVKNGLIVKLLGGN